MCLVTLWKCYFPPPPPQNPPPHNRKTTKTPPPTPPPQQQQQNQRSKRESKKSKSQTNFITKISNENENELVRVGSSVWVGLRCDDLSTLFVSLFARGSEMARRSRWSVTGFDKGGFERSERCDCLAPMSAIFLLFLSLFLFYFPRPKIIWSENENENDFPLFWLSFSVNWKCFSVWPNLK